MRNVSTYAHIHGRTHRLDMLPMLFYKVTCLCGKSQLTHSSNLDDIGLTVRKTFLNLNQEKAREY